MAARKINPAEFQKLYREAEKNLHDKKTVESLVKRLNDKIMKDPKKAALIIEEWLKKKPKP
jgi:ribosomal protein S7